MYKGYSYKTIIFNALLAFVFSISATFSGFLGYRLVNPQSFLLAANSGAIWTTNGSCGDPQNVNHYPSGSTIYINGSNFETGNYAWEISDPGNNGTVYLNGNQNVDSSGAFCFPAGIVPDGGPYQATFGNSKGDNFSIDAANPTPTLTPTLTPTPTDVPTATPTDVPPTTPTDVPTPTLTPTPQPTATLTPTPISEPSLTPTQEPSPTPTSGEPTPTESVAPTLTPTPQVLGTSTTTNDVCTNLDGIQTTVPDGWFQNGANSTECRQFQYGDPPQSGDSPTGQVLGTSTSIDNPKPGQVLGASTLGATGGLEDYYNYFFVLGLILIGISTYGLTLSSLKVKE